jgi:c-di-GMP-binding flagellar brake protein YcgR
MLGETEKLVRDAVARNVAIVLSLPSAGMLRHCKSRFLDACPEGFWVEATPEHTSLVDDLIKRAEPAGVSFKAGTRTVSFASVLLRRDPKHALNNQTAVEAILLSHPAQVKSMQRRSNYRVHTGADSGLTVRMWRIPDHAYLKDQPPASTQVPFNLCDLSIGGMGVILGQASVKLATEQRLRIEICPEGQEPLVLEGRLKYSRAGVTPGAGTRAGVQFKKLENDLDGRQALMKLTRIVGDLQREEVRRMRLGLAG